MQPTLNNMPYVLSCLHRSDKMHLLSVLKGLPIITPSTYACTWKVNLTHHSWDLNTYLEVLYKITYYFLFAFALMNFKRSYFILFLSCLMSKSCRSALPLFVLPSVYTIISDHSFAQSNEIFCSLLGKQPFGVGGAS